MPPATAAAPPVPHHELLGTGVDAFTSETFLAYLADAVERDGQTVIANHNVNSLVLHQRSVEFRRFYERADAIFIDGMPVVGMGRLLGQDVHADNRIGVLDWIWPLAALAEAAGWHIVHVGGTDAVRHQAKAELRARHPDLELTTINGYFDASPGRGTQALLDRLDALEPDVLLLGMGMPRQEMWALENLDSLPRCPIITVGGIFGYLAGDRPTPPRWLGPLGLEWAYRLATEPTRLWRRYLVEPTALVSPLVREAVGARTHDR